MESGDIQRGGLVEARGEDYYRTLVELVPDVIYAVGPDGSLTDLSPAFEEITGWPVSEWIGRPFIEMIHPDDISAAAGSFRSCLEGQVPPPHQLRVRASSGDFLVGEFRSMPRLEAGIVTGMIGVARDVSDRVRAEEELQRSRDQLDVILQGIDDGITVQDPSGRVIYANSAAARIVGFHSVSEFLNSTRSELMPAHNVRDESGNSISLSELPGRRVLQGEESQEAILRFTNQVTGQERWAVVKAAPVRDAQGIPQLAINVFQDITDRRQAEAILERQADLLNLAYDAILVRDFETSTIQFWNRGAEAMYGWTADEARGQVSHVLLSTIHPQPMDEMMASLVETGRWEGELTHTARDGKRIVVASRWAARFEAGRPVAILEINTDVTERTHAEEVRTRLAAIVESTDDAIISKDLDGIIQNWNPGAQRLYGYSREEIIGKSVSTLVPSGRPHEIPAIMARIARGEAINHYETVRVRKDGTQINVSISISPLRDSKGRIIGAATIARDITESKRIEAERARLLANEREARAHAEAAQARLSFLAEASDILATSLDYETTLSNVAMLAVPYVGDWCTIDLIEEDGTVRRLAVTHPDPEKVKFARALEERYPPTLGETTTSTLGGREPRLIEEISDKMLTAAARDEEHLEILRQLGLRSAMTIPLVARERPLGVISFIAAESRRRFGPDDLALAEDLGHRIAVAVDNARLHRETEMALKLREEFLTIASHELKTPLTSLQLQMQILERSASHGSLAEMPPDRAARILDGSQRQIRRLSKLINDLLDVSRISAGRLELERQETNLAEIVKDVVERFSAEISQTGAEVNVTAAPVTGEWDRFRLDQVVTNLLSNALKYGNGSTIDVTVVADNGIAKVTVRDRGLGIAEHNTHRIFDRFERIELSRSYGGLGLGLYISRQIVEAHGGKIRVESSPGAGSTFIVELPR